MAGDPSYNSVTLLLHGDGAHGSTTFTDNSPTPKTVTATACTISTVQSKFDGASMAFNGSNAHLSLADSTDWDFGVGDFTVEVWARFTSHTATQTMVGNYKDATYGWAFQRRADANTLRFGNGNTALLDVSWAPTDNVWYHLAIARGGTNLRCFVDGVQVGSTVTNSTDVGGSTNNLLVGDLFAGSFLQPFNGYLDDLRITKGVARYTADFTPPDAAFSNFSTQISGTVRDASGALCARTVRAYTRSTGALVGATVSDAVTGVYAIGAPVAEHTVIVLDDDAGTQYNALVLDKVIAA